jgi:hypothetical protein
MPATKTDAVAEVLAAGGTKTVLPAVKPSPTRKGTGTKKAKPAAKKQPKVEGSARASNRLTDVWPSKSGKDVKVKDKVKLKDGTTVTCVGRWSKHLKDGGLVPMVTGTTSDGTRKNSPAAEVTHVAKK